MVEGCHHTSSMVNAKLLAIFPTVSMGLGPIMSIYQAHIMKYLEQRGLFREQSKSKGLDVLWRW